MDKPSGEAERNVVLRLLAQVILLLPLQMMAQSNIVKLQTGKLEGVTSANQDVIVFRGVPYAQPPVGSLRWKAPQAVKPWKGVKRCDAFSAKSWQGGQESGSFYEKEFYQNDTLPMSEDCLYLNIWVPKNALGDGAKHSQTQ